MAKPTGFLEYIREVAPDRPPLERIRDWEEFHTALSAEAQCQQGARCMDCGTPTCHSGLMLGGMASGCPLNNLIPEWNELVYRGMWRQAADRLLKTNNFPEFTGRVCPAPCEGACTVGLDGDPVAIKADECAIIDRAYDEGWMVPSPPRSRTGLKVAVVGSGPAGLACADQLNQAGHSVTVFERADRAGGLLMYGIPNMKLDKRRVQRRVGRMEQEGITFRTGLEAGRDISAQSLRKDFDAVVLCTGATRPRDLKVPGREAEGICFAVDYLHRNTKSLLDSGHADGDYISAKGLDVVVVGGGDTGNDCVGTAIRQGCKSVTQFEIMPPLPAERAPGNPWPEWPRVLRTDYGQEEAKALFGHDPRQYGVSTKTIESGSDGRVCALHTVQVKWQPGENGRRVPVEQPGTERTWPAQLVLIAMGFLGVETGLPEALGAKIGPRGAITAPENSYATGVPGLFAAGDARRGQSLVVWAIHEGRKAAEACDAWLRSQNNA